MSSSEDSDGERYSFDPLETVIGGSSSESEGEGEGEGEEDGEDEVTSDEPTLSPPNPGSESKSEEGGDSDYEPDDEEEATGSDDDGEEDDEEASGDDEVSNETSFRRQTSAPLSAAAQAPDADSISSRLRKRKPDEDLKQSPEKKIKDSPLSSSPVATSASPSAAPASISSTEEKKMTLVESARFSFTGSTVEAKEMDARTACQLKSFQKLVEKKTKPKSKKKPDLEQTATLEAIRNPTHVRFPLTDGQKVLLDVLANGTAPKEEEHAEQGESSGESNDNEEDEEDEEESVENILEVLFHEPMENATAFADLLDPKVLRNAVQESGLESLLRRYKKISESKCFVPGPRHLWQLPFEPLDATEEARDEFEKVICRFFLETASLKKNTEFEAFVCQSRRTQRETVIDKILKRAAHWIQVASGKKPQGSKKQSAFQGDDLMDNEHTAKILPNTRALLGPIKFTEALTGAAAVPGAVASAVPAAALPPAHGNSSNQPSAAVSAPAPPVKPKRRIVPVSLPPEK